MAEDIIALAKEAGAELGVPWSYVYGQWSHETDNFSSYVANVYNNLAGIKNYNNMAEYQTYNSLTDFKNAYVRLLKKYEGVPNAPNLETFTSNLKAGGYFGDTLSNYYNGIVTRLKQASDAPTSQIDTSILSNLSLNPFAGSSDSTTATGLGAMAQNIVSRAGYILAGIALFGLGVFSLYKRIS